MQFKPGCLPWCFSCKCNNTFPYKHTERGGLNKSTNTHMDTHTAMHWQTHSQPRTQKQVYTLSHKGGAAEMRFWAARAKCCLTLRQNTLKYSNCGKQLGHLHPRIYFLLHKVDKDTDTHNMSCKKHLIACNLKCFLNHKYSLWLLFNKRDLKKKIKWSFVNCRALIKLRGWVPAPPSVLNQ